LQFISNSANLLLKYPFTLKPTKFSYWEYAVTISVPLDILLFVYVHLRCIANKLKKVRKMSTLSPLEKFLRTPISLIVLPT